MYQSGTVINYSDWMIVICNVQSLLCSSGHYASVTHTASIGRNEPRSRRIGNCVRLNLKNLHSQYAAAQLCMSLEHKTSASLQLPGAGSVACGVS
jgi:hypothetical protein